MKVTSSFQSGRAGSIVFVNSRYGPIARRFVQPRNPQTIPQQANRRTLGSVSGHWRHLTPEQRAAWYLAAGSKYTTTHTGQRVPLNGYNYFVSVSSKRVNRGLPRADMPPAEPTFSPNPVGELAAANTDGGFVLKIRVPVAPAPDTVVQAAAPASPGARCIQHFPILGLLPPPINGWSDITDLYVQRYGVPPVGMVIHIRTRQYIDGWSDLPKQTSAPVPAPA